MNKNIIKMIYNRKQLFGQEGGIWTATWREKKGETNELIRKRNQGYLETQKGHILADDAYRNFFKHVKNFNTIENPRQFNVRQLLPGKKDFIVAEELAGYVNKISYEFDLLEPSDIPQTKPRPFPSLQKYKVSTRIGKFRKPKSMVRGDIFPKLMTALSSIYNEILTTFA